MTDIVGNETLRSLWQTVAARCGQREFLTFHNREDRVFRYSYAQFDEEVNRIANTFLRLGVRKGERVALQLHSSPEFLMCLFGLAKIGAVVVPVNERYLADEAEYILRDADITCAVIEPLFVGVYQELMARGMRFPKGLLVGRGGADSPSTDVDVKALCAASAAEVADVAEGQGGLQGSEQADAPVAKQAIHDFWALRCESSASLDEASLCALCSDDPVQILYTSGTSSRPKGVVITHANMVFAGLYGDWEVSLRGSDKVLSTMPACHSNFQLAALMPVITAGASIVVVEKYSARSYWGQVRRYGATVIQMVAMMLRTLMLQPPDEHEREHRVREVLYFMEVSDHEKEAFEQRFAVRIMNTYGSTESIGWAITDPPTGKRNWPSVGRAGLSYEARIVDEDDRELPAGQVGEIQVKGVRGRSLMQGYWNNPQATAAAFTADGWMRMGDRGYRDESGWFYFVDRKSSMVKRGGENISTAEIERVLVEHPKVAEAAAIGVPDPIRDQAIKAFVLPVPGERLDVAELEEYCRAKMAAFKVPSFFEVVSEFPRTVSMKVEKRLLK